MTGRDNGSESTRQLPERERERYVSDIIRLHSTLDFRSLPDHVLGDPLYSVYDPTDELITLTVEDDQLPLRYLNGIMGFRLVQYLRLGWMSPQLVYERAVFRETVRHPPGVQNVHTVSLCTRTGRIRGYISLGCSQDPVSMPLDHPDRGRFSTEAAHDIDLLGRFAADGLGTHQAFEIKRFVRDLELPPGPSTERVPWHLLLGLGRVISGAGDRMRLMLGDAKEKVAIRHFRLTGFDLQIDRGTSPRLPETDLMAPIYDQDVIAVPFVAPVHADLGDYMDLIEDYLGGGPDAMTLMELVAAMTARRTGAYRMKEAS
ncbi:hypothetical protein ACOT81_37060 [Streptomyces sp. WI04-05B]|uniref:hypothetical protein n=1 Tax=Streptomyces TaxID=1883 RepID=UPI0029A15AAD|nr:MULTISPECIES: hypothetical protein [unclassified Streptomyces]MDX2546404.1 hypothetical protein [Streptomyces sp. WI04-05B]MDX2586235.1 hypothetical protein [Streptomyces sp. WI04-05A]MDX3748885.1 hypothetical protein [Streptomyces sp. AK08-02]